MPASVCLTPGCPTPAAYRGRCAPCAAKHDRTINRAGYRIYRTVRWRNTRRAYLLEHPLCEHAECERLATDVHHRIDISDDGDPWDWDNLEALCHRHHGQETRRRALSR